MAILKITGNLNQGGRAAGVSRMRNYRKYASSYLKAGRLVALNEAE